MEMVAFWVLQGLGVLIGLLYVLGLTRKYRLPGLRALGCVASAEAVSALMFLVLQMLLPSSFEGRNGFLTIAFFPLFLCIFSAVFRLPVSKMPELASPVLLIMLVFDRIACQCAGRCASSFSVSWGIFNGVAQKKLLPLQLFEAAAGLLALAALLLWRQKRKSAEGTRVPFVFVTIGTILFLTSFLRAGATVIGALSEQALLGLFIIAEGLIWLAARRVFSRLRDLVNN